MAQPEAYLLKYDVEIKREQVGVKIAVLILLGPVESGESLRRCNRRGAGRIGVRRLSTLRKHRIFTQISRN
jgi:hypothetical protein